MREPGTSHSPYGRVVTLMRRRAVASSVGLLLGIALLTGCSSPPPPSPKPVVTAVQLTLVAGVDVNPDVRGRASPLTVRVYALKNVTDFEGADFFSLFDKDQATLGAELVQREEVLLRPGESRTVDMTLPPDAKAIAVMAAYRDLDRARWREVRALDVGKPLNATIRFGARHIAIEPR